MSRPAKSPSSRRLLTIRIDGSSRGNPGPAGIGVILSDGSGRKVKEISTYLGFATNNVAESIALIVGLQEALKLGQREVTVLTDSQLLARQVTGAYRVKDPQLKWIHVLIRQLLEGLNRFEIRHVPREKNKQADQLANWAVAEGLKRPPPARPKKPSVLDPSRADQATFW